MSGSLAGSMTTTDGATAAGNDTGVDTGTVLAVCTSVGRVGGRGRALAQSCDVTAGTVENA